MFRLLIIEDDEATATLLKKGLSEAGYSIELAADGVTGLAKASGGKFDLVIADVLLPGLSGWEIVSELRRSDSHTPVLMLTARDAVEDRVRGLRLGADDYLIKPFSLEELVARVSALSRRLSRPLTGPIAYEDLRLVEPARRVFRGEREIDLSGKEFELLQLLMRHQGEILSREYISAQVWGLTVDCESNVIDVNVRRLRRKIDDPFARKVIHTVRGQGYVIR